MEALEDTSALAMCRKQKELALINQNLAKAYLIEIKVVSR
jgi:hypothetical protein